MRWYSTPESAERREPTVLAVVETACACGVAVWIALTTGSLLFVLIGAAVAPLLLLRTHASTERGIRWFVAIDDWCAATVFGFYPSPPRSLLLLFAWWIGFVPVIVLLSGGHALVAFVARIAALCYSIGTAFPEHVRAIPGNWFRYAICTDTMHVPELVPGCELADEVRFPRYRISRILQFTAYPLVALDRNTNYSASERFFGVIVDLTLRAIMFSAFIIPLLIFSIPSIAYRWSLKSSSIVWAPLIWLCHSHSRADRYDAVDAVDDLLHGTVERTQRVWAIVFIVGFLAALSIDVVATSVVLRLRDSPPAIRTLLDLYVPGSLNVVDLKGWHAARFLNALAFLGLWLYAERVERRWMKGRDTGEWEPSAVRSKLSRGMWAMLVLSAYTWTCAWVSILRFAVTMDVPPVRWEWFPTW